MRVFEKPSPVQRYAAMTIEHIGDPALVSHFRFAMHVAVPIQGVGTALGASGGRGVIAHGGQGIVTDDEARSDWNSPFAIVSWTEDSYILVVARILVEKRTIIVVQDKRTRCQEILGGIGVHSTVVNGVNKIANAIPAKLYPHSSASGTNPGRETVDPLEIDANGASPGRSKLAGRELNLASGATDFSRKSTLNISGEDA